MRSGTAVAERREERTFTETARRAQIVQAAIDTIAELGYGRASLARIAERLGISKGVISYHFAGKDDLIKEVVLEVVESGRNGLSADDARRFYGDTDVDTAVLVLEQLLGQWTGWGAQP
jgi:AcrR family transcriptional regulator